MSALLFIVIPMIAACAIAFVLGCCWQAGEADDQADAERAAMFGDCPWPLRPDDIAARPDWAAVRETRGTRADGGIPGHLHNQNSSGLLSGRSESPS